MPDETGWGALTKTAYEHLVAAVGKILEEWKKAGERRNLGKSGL